MHRSPSLLSLSLLALLACAPPKVDPTQPPERQVQTSLILLERALRANDPDQAAALFSEDAVLQEGSHAPQRGRSAIRAQLLAPGYKVWNTSWTPLATVQEGPRVRQTGWMVNQVITPKDHLAGARCRFEALWTQGADSIWRIQRLELVADR